ncbi:hypothetical protein [Agromyces sp. H66]|uniref:hypothetical protein n=1 Tax=Agromyces sp. H66 TaxID=2529859 RepID=UPI0010A9D3DD|nr:hypothetical protein [Agromyces sp. H66]
MSSTTPGSEPERPHDADGHEPPTSEREADVTDEGLPSPESEPVPPAEASEPAASDPAASEPAASEPAVPEPAEEPLESPDATARLDAAVERANAAHGASDADDDGDVQDAVPEPVPADTVRRETYVPAATVAAPGIAAGAATVAPEPEVVPPPAPAPAPQTVYVQAPAPPKLRSNRGFGVLVALIGAVVFALLYAGVAYLLLLARGDTAETTDAFVDFLLSPVFWVPSLAFLLGFALLAAIVNRGAWWYYAVFGLLVAALVYFAYIGGAVLSVQAWRLPVDDSAGFLRERWLDPFAIAAFVIAREIPIWFGGWLAARGRAVTERNRIARETYERELAAGPQPQRS